MWYQTECAAAYSRKQEWGNALRHCHQIDKVSVLFYLSVLWCELNCLTCTYISLTLLHIHECICLH